LKKLQGGWPEPRKRKGQKGEREDLADQKGHDPGERGMWRSRVAHRKKGKSEPARIRGGNVEGKARNEGR